MYCTPLVRSFPLLPSRDKHLLLPTLRLLHLLKINQLSDACQEQRFQTNHWFCVVERDIEPTPTSVRISLSPSGVLKELSKDKYIEERPWLQVCTCLTVVLYIAFLFVRQLRPSILQRLLRKLVQDIPKLTKNTDVALTVRFLFSLFFC